MNPVLFSLGSLHIYAYGTMIAIGVILAVQLMTRRCRIESGLTPPVVYDLVFTILVTGFFGARIFYVIENFPAYAGRPFSAFAFWEGGLIYYGGVIAAFAGVFFFSRIKKIGFVHMLDFSLPYIALVHAFGRIGCFLNGCCHGKVCDLPWAVKFPHLADKVHPTQLYEVALNLILFFALYRFYPKRRFNGEIAGFYFLFYGTGRFIIEFWREQYSSWLLFSWNQWVSLGLIALGAIFLRPLRSKGADQPMGRVE